MAGSDVGAPDVVCHVSAGLDAAKDTDGSTLPPGDPEPLLFVLRKVIIDDGGGVVALGEGEVNGRSGVQGVSGAIAEALHVLESGAGGLYHVAPMRALDIDAIEDFGEVFRQEFDLAAGFCDGPDGAGWRLQVVMRRRLGHGDGDISAVRLRIAQGCERGAVPRDALAEDVEIEIEDFQVVGTLAMETFDECLALVPMVEGLNGLVRGRWR